MKDDSKDKRPNKDKGLRWRDQIREDTKISKTKGNGEDLYTKSEVR